MLLNFLMSLSLEIDLKDFFLPLIYKTSISPFLPSSFDYNTKKKKLFKKMKIFFFLIVKTSMVVAENLLNIEM